MDKDVFQIKVNEYNPLNESDIENWDILFRIWKNAQKSRCRKIIKENYGSDDDFIKDVEDLTKNKYFHEALITIYQKLVANFIEEIERYWTGLEKDKNSALALLCTKYGLDIEHAKSLFECPDYHYSRHPWGVYITSSSTIEAPRSKQISWLLTKGEDALRDRLQRLPTPKDTDTETKQQEEEKN